MNKNREEVILILAETYAAKARLSMATIGIYAVKNSRLISAIKNGASCTIRTYDRVLQWFSDNWPSDLAWPSDIPRPEKTEINHA